MTLQVAQKNPLLNAKRHPISAVPGLQRLFLDYCSGAQAVRPFYPPGQASAGWTARPALPAHWPELVSVLAELQSSMVSEAFVDTKLAQAGAIFERVALESPFIEFLTLPAYDLID